MKNPKIALLIPCYNQAAYLPSLFESLLNQNYTNLHIQISNDASTDNTEEVIRKYIEPLGKKFTHVISTSHLFNLGLEGRNNFAWMSTQIPDDCEYVSIIEGDDFIKDPNRYQKQLEKLESGQFGAVHSDVTALYANGNVCEGFWKTYRSSQTGGDPQIPEGDITVHLIKANFIYSCSLLVKTELYKKAFDFNLFTNLKIFLGDYAGVLRLSKLASIGYVNESLMNYRVLPTSSSHGNRERVVGDTMYLQALAKSGALFI